MKYILKSTLTGFIEEFSKIFKYPTSSSIHNIIGGLALIFNTLHQKRIENKRVLTKFAWAY